MRFYLIIILFSIISCGPRAEGEAETTDTKGNEVIIDIDSTDSDNIEETTQVELTEELGEQEYVSDEYEDINWDEYMDEMTKDFSFVIIISTPDYDAALERAKDASEKLEYPLDLRGLHPNEEMGLSLPEEVCTAICGGDVVEYPQYLPRNDWGETKYVSIEYSNGYDGFNPGYYIVIVASGEKGDPIIQEALEESQQFYEDAYAKTCGVWIGCGC